MNKNIANLKGFRDFLPQDALKREWLKSQILSVFKLWGFDPMETPTLEPLELFAGQIGEDEKLFYKFTDNGDREVALRYDQTVPTCRVVGQNAQNLPMPFRRYQIQPVFRAENTQKGRYREFLQCDADIFGESSNLADAEVIALSLDIYRKLGFKNARVLVNDRSLLKDVPYEAIVAVDKLKKIGEEGVISDMVKKGIEPDEARKYLEFFKNLTPNETIETIFDYLRKMGFDESNFVFEPTLARSFSYSTGPIWEVEINGSIGGSVLGGERFDALVEGVSGAKIPATGFGLGFDRTLEALEEAGLVPSFSTNTRVLVTVFNEEMYEKSLEIVNLLRKNGVPSEIYPSKDVKLDKQLKYANRKGIMYVVVIGPEEAERDKVSLKNMMTGERTEIEIASLPSLF